MTTNTAPRFKGALFDKLKTVRPQVRHDTRAEKPDFMRPMPSVDRWTADGQDHINIYERGDVELGQALAHASPIPFKHSHFGKFNSMAAFWHYIQSTERDDRMRTIPIQKLKAFARQMTATMVPNFRALIIDANYQRVKQYQAIVDELVTSELPFDLYYIDSDTGARQRSTYSSWVVAGFEEIRAALKEGREPDFMKFMDNKDKSLYAAAESMVREQPQANKKKPEGNLINKLRAQAEEQEKLDEQKVYSVETVAEGQAPVEEVAELQATGA